MNICLKCNNPFEPNSNAQKYCLCCRSEAYKAVGALWCRNHPKDPLKVKINNARFYKKHPTYRKDHLKHAKAWDALNNAIKAGKLIRLPCRVCNNPKSEGHHYLGYAKGNRLKVVWLCCRHHKEAEHQKGGVNAS